MRVTDKFPRGALSQLEFNALSENVDNEKLGSPL